MFRNHRTESYVDICKTLGYQFKQKKLLLQALTRKAAHHESIQSPQIGYNQRLEFLGDRVIDLAISDLLFEAHPEWTEGQLTQAKAQLVNNSGPLVKVAQGLNLQEYIIAGYGEDIQRIRYQDKALSDVVEALFGAVFIDSNRDYKLMRQLVKQHWSSSGLLDVDVSSIEVDHSSKQSIGSEDTLDEQLIDSILAGNVQQSKALLAKGANPNLTCPLNNKSSFGSVLQLAILLKQIDIAKALIKAGATVNWQGGYKVIRLLPYKRAYTVTELFAPHQETVFNKKTALHYVTELVKQDESISIEAVVELIGCLLDADADVSLPDADGQLAIRHLDKENNAHRLLYNKLQKANESPTMQLIKSESAKGLITEEIHDLFSAALPELIDEDVEHMASDLSSFMLH